MHLDPPGDYVVTGSYGLVDSLTLSDVVFGETTFLTYTDGTYSMLGDWMALQVPLFGATTWEANLPPVTKEYDLADGLTLTLFTVTSANWVQYGLVKYSNFIVDELTLSSPTITNTTWT